MAKAMVKELKATMKGFKKLPAADQQMAIDFANDMKAGKEVSELASQKEEFFSYLSEKVAKAKNNEFFKSMLTKVEGGVILTENMVNAIRKCKTQDAQWAAEKTEKEAQKDQPIDYKKCTKLTLKMKPWWMKANKLESLVITGYVVAESAKAYLIHGHADMIEGCWCMRCGKELTLPASYTIGYGETCASKMGVPYPGDLNVMTAKQKAAYKKTILKTLHNQTFEAWVPKSQVVEILKEEKPGK